MTVYKKKDKWYYQFMLNGERKHGLCTGASDKKEAEQIENAIKFRLAQQQNGVIPREEKNISLKQLKSSYIRYAKCNKSSYTKDLSFLKYIQLDAVSNANPSLKYLAEKCPLEISVHEM